MNILIKNFLVEFYGFIIVYLLDLYVGFIIGKIMLEKVVKIINRLNLDVIIIVGDLVDVIVF